MQKPRGQGIGREGDTEVTPSFPTAPKLELKPRLLGERGPGGEGIIGGQRGRPASCCSARPGIQFPVRRRPPAPPHGDPGIGPWLLRSLEKGQEVDMSATAPTPRCTLRHRSMCTSTHGLTSGHTPDMCTHFHTFIQSRMY